MNRGQNKTYMSELNFDGDFKIPIPKKKSAFSLVMPTKKATAEDAGLAQKINLFTRQKIRILKIL